MRTSVTIDQSQIVFRINTFIFKNYKVEFLQEFEDLIIRHHNNHNIVFEDDDGNDVNHPEFRAWLQRLCLALNIPTNKIIFKTQIPPTDPYTWIQLNDRYRISDVDFDSLNQDRSKAQFVGCLAASRPSMARTRMVYELGTAFDNDCFLTCKPEPIIARLSEVNSDIFAEEIEWFKNRKFNNDQPSNIACLSMYDASRDYWNIWNKFNIEVVCETDEYMSNRLTDKVAKPLSSGKPFVLLCGVNSLQHLQNLGFVTYNNFLDESYDQCQLPGQRIKAIIHSLLELYKSSDRNNTIDRMYSHAQQNIELYRKITPWVRENAYFEGHKETWSQFPVITK